MTGTSIRGVLLIARRSLRQHALSTTITVLLVALASGLTMAVFAIRHQTHRAFVAGPVGFDAVLGARGSQLQLVLNTVFHLETSPGNIPWSMYETIKNDPGVSLAIPYAVGDNYRGYRIVGTTPDLFARVEHQAGRALTLAGGRVFDTRQREAVVGSYAAQRTGLRIGATFSPYHGLQFDEHSRHRDVFTVVGVLEPTNSPSDRVIWIPLDGIFRMAGHVLRGTGEPVTAEGDGEIADEHKEVSAVMLRLRDPQAGFALSQSINREGKAATLAWPIARVMAELFDKIGWVDRVLALVAYLVVLVAAASVLASLYNTMNERRREFAILRSLGARRETIVAAVLAEAGAISTLGVLVGYVVYGAILAVAVVTIRNQTGVVLDAFSLDPALLLTPAALVMLGTMAGIVPAMRAYRTDVAANLSPLS